MAVQCNNVQLEQCKEIMRTHKCPVATPRALWARLQEGLLVDGNTYFWLDYEPSLGVELYARAFSITWGSHPEYWTYFHEKIPNSEYTVEVAQLKNVCWLDVKGEFDMRKLTAEAEYEILFDIELTCGAQGWSRPVTFEHNSPFGLKTHFDMELDHLRGKGRTQISVGKFKLPCIRIGTPCATFRMYQHGSHWKSGLIMRGVIIKPVNHCNQKSDQYHLSYGAVVDQEQEMVCALNKTKRLLWKAYSSSPVSFEVSYF